MQPLDPSQYALALHTTSSQLGLAVSNFADDTRSSIWDLGRDLSSHLHQHLTDFLIPQKWADLAFIAVAKGPGSFTSTRIGIVTARTLAQQLEIPLFGISTLAAVAWGQKQEAVENSNQKAIALQMEAHRGELFVAIYQASSIDLRLTPLLLDTVMTREGWKQILESLKTPYQLIEVPAELGASVTSVLSLAYLHWQQGKRPQWSEVLPFYGQHPVDSKIAK